MRMTRQRQMILDELAAARSHPTADELYERLRCRLPRISLGTVYRNLELLSQAGRIQRLGPGGMQRRFDADLRPHYHVRCTACGRVDDVPVEPMAHLEPLARDRCEYEVTGHWLEFRGLCPSCRQGPRPPV